MSMIMAAMVFLTIGTGYVQAQDKTSDSASELPKVYLIKEITPENLVKIYEALGRKAEGKVAVKLSTGEPGELPSKSVQANRADIIFSSRHSLHHLYGK